MIEPLMDEILRHPRIKLMTLAEVEEVLGCSGNFTVRIRQHARHVDVAGCDGCKSSQAVCPVLGPNPYESDLATRKAVYIAYSGCLPNVSLIDESACRNFCDRSCDACVAACPFGNINLAACDEDVEVHAGAVLLATGADFEVSSEADSGLPLPQVFTTMALERMLNASGCTGGAALGCTAQGTTRTGTAAVTATDSDSRCSALRIAPLNRQTSMSPSGIATTSARLKSSTHGQNTRATAAATCSNRSPISSTAMSQPPHAAPQ